MDKNEEGGFNLSTSERATQMAGREPGGGSAFPLHAIGLTKREWFAGMALMGLCANPNLVSLSGIGVLAIDIKAVTDGLADAMLAEGRKEQEDK